MMVLQFVPNNLHLSTTTEETEHDMKDGGTRLIYAELKSSNRALLQALGEQHLKIAELTNKLESSEVTVACHKRSQEYAFEDLAELEDKYKEAQSLLDACYEVVELWDCQAPSQIEWKREWLEGARQHWASGI